MKAIWWIFNIVAFAFAGYFICMAVWHHVNI